MFDLAEPGSVVRPVALHGSSPKELVVRSTCKSIIDHPQLKHKGCLTMVMGQLSTGMCRRSDMWQRECSFSRKIDQKDEQSRKVGALFGGREANGPRTHMGSFMVMGRRLAKPRGLRIG